MQEINFLAGFEGKGGIFLTGIPGIIDEGGVRGVDESRVLGFLKF